MEYQQTDGLMDAVRWLRSEKCISFASNKMSHKIIQSRMPNIIVRSMNQYRKNSRTRLSGPNKLGVPPNLFGNSSFTKLQFKTRDYFHYDLIPENIQNIREAKKKHFDGFSPHGPETPLPPPPHTNVDNVLFLQYQL